MSDQYVWVVHYDAYGDRWLHGIYDSEENVSAFLPQDPDRPWECNYEVTKARVWSVPGKRLEDE